MSVRLSPSHKWLNVIATSNSLKPSRAVCIPPKCLTPRNSASRAKNVTSVSPMTGHQETFVAGSCGLNRRKAGMTTTLMASRVYRVTVGAGTS